MKFKIHSPVPPVQDQVEQLDVRLMVDGDGDLALQFRPAGETEWQAACHVIESEGLDARGRVSLFIHSDRAWIL